MAFTWTNEVPTAGATIMQPALPLETRVKLDSIRDSLCTTHYYSHNSVKDATNLSTNYNHQSMNYSSLKNHDVTVKSTANSSYKNHAAGYCGSNKEAYDSGYKSGYYSGVQSTYDNLDCATPG